MNIRVEGSITCSAGSIDNRKFKLFIISTEFNKEVKYFINDFFGSCTGAVYFIYDNKRFFAESKGFFKNETGLGHTALKSVNEEENTVNHHKNTFHFTAKIGMTGSINDIYFCIFVHNGSIF